MPTHALKLRNRQILRDAGIKKGILSAWPIWRGPSEIDGKPMIVALSNFTTACENGKVSGNEKGQNKAEDVCQVWYFREDIEPNVMYKENMESACGDCIHMKKQSCYVIWHRSPLAIWKAVKTKPLLSEDLIEKVTDGLFVRLGAAGDPCSVPAEVSMALIDKARGWAGYTHQWHKIDHLSPFKHFLMASADSKYQADLAQSWGWRTFRTVEPDQAEPMNSREVLCHAESMGSNCADCGLCGGIGWIKPKTGRYAFQRYKNIFIPVHGSGAGNYKPSDQKYKEIPLDHIVEGWEVMK